MHPIRRLLATVPLALALAGPVHADCYADYKAKLDDPLRLNYGVVQLPDAICNDPAQVRAEVAARISRDGWHLLSVLGVFGPEGLEQRKQSAGPYFLRY